MDETASQTNRSRIRIARQSCALLFSLCGLIPGVLSAQPGATNPTLVGGAAPAASPLHERITADTARLRESLESWDLPEAERCQKRVVSDLRKLLGEHADIVLSGMNLSDRLAAARDGDATATRELVGMLLPAAIQRGDLDAAARHALHLSEVIGERDDVPLRRQVRGWVFVARWCLNHGQLSHAATAADRARQLLGTDPMSDLGNAELAWSVGLIQGQVHERREHYAEAEENFRQVLAATESRPELIARSSAIDALHGLVQLARSQGRLTEADELGRRSLTLAEHSNDQFVHATADGLLTLAAVWRTQGRLSEACAACRQSIERYGRLGDATSLEQATAWNELALVHVELGENAEALDAANEALSIAISVLGNSSPVVARYRANLAEIARRMPAQVRQRYEPYLRFAQQGLAVHEDVPARVRATLNQTAGLFLELDGDLAGALAEYESAWQLRRELLGDDHPTTARARYLIGRAQLESGDAMLAEENLLATLKVREQRLGREHLETVTTLTELAACAECLGNLSAALDRYQDGQERFIAALETVGVTGMDAVGLGEGARLSVRRVTLLADQGQFERATQVWFETLGRNVADEQWARDRRRLRPEQERALRQLEERLRTLESAVLAAGDNPAQAKQFQFELLAAKAALASQRHAMLPKAEHRPAEAWSLSELQSRIPEDAAIVGWVQREAPACSSVGRSWAIVVRHRGAPEWIRLNPTDDDSANCRRLAYDLTDVALPEVSEQIETVRLHVWNPVETVLRSVTPPVKRLLVLPSPGVQGIPIELLAGADYVVSYLPSPAVFVDLQSKRSEFLARRDLQGLMAVGDPRFAGTSETTDNARRAVVYQPLPGSRREVLSLESLFIRAHQPTTIRLGSDASEQALVELNEARALGRFRYLHFATHGVANPDRALRSKLILAQDQLPDPVRQLAAGLPVFTGELSAETVLRTWDLHADLVTLSACESGLGYWTPTEGHLGFAQALLLAGARSTLLSLWQVNDDATALLMTRFYENLLGGRAELSRPMAKAESLHEAKEWLRRLSQSQVDALRTRLDQGTSQILPAGSDEPRPYAHPYFWSAFVLVGDFE